MRLTLRTLLAYLDDLLEPQQAKDLGERIARSEEAAGIVSRIRSVLRKRRIEAPAIGAKAKPDANVVAAYLDNQLEPAEVEAFETAALTDDVVLAEAAGTHQILSVVLGEPVSVSSELRLQMYGLAGMDGAPATSSPSVPVVGARRHRSGEDAVEPATGDRSRWPLVLGLLLLVGWSGLLAYFLSDRGGAENPPVVAEDRRGDDREDGVDADSAVAVAVPEGVADVVENQNVENMNAENGSVENERSDLSGRVATDDEEGDSDAVPDSLMAASPTQPAEKAIVEIDPMTPDEPESEPVTVASIFADSKADPVAESPAEEPLAMAATPDPAVVTEPAGEDAEATADAPETLPNLRYQLNAGQEVVLHLESEDDDWSVLPPRSRLFAGETIVVPPLYTPSIRIEGPGMPTVTFLGPTHAVLLSATAGSPGGVELDRGRLLIDWTDAMQPFSLALGTKTGRREITLAPGGGRLALEVAETIPGGHIVGVDRELAAELIVISGSVELEKTDRAVATTLRAGRGLSLIQDDEPNGAEPPAWASSDAIAGSLLDRRYRIAFADALPGGDDLVQELEAMQTDPKFRVASMATQTLGLIGNLNDVVAGLFNEHAETRQLAANELRRQISLDADALEQIDGLLRHRLREDDAILTERLLVGFDRDELRRVQTSREVVDALSHPEVSVRELAAAALQRLKIRMYDYQADASDAQRMGAVRRFEDLLDSKRALVEPPIDDRDPSDPFEGLEIGQ